MDNTTKIVSIKDEIINSIKSKEQKIITIQNKLKDFPSKIKNIINSYKTDSESKISSLKKQIEELTSNQEKENKDLENKLSEKNQDMINDINTQIENLNAIGRSLDKLDGEANNIQTVIDDANDIREGNAMESMGELYKSKDDISPIVNPLFINKRKQIADYLIASVGGNPEVYEKYIANASASAYEELLKLEGDTSDDDAKTKLTENINKIIEKQQTGTQLDSDDDKVINDIEEAFSGLMQGFKDVSKITPDQFNSLDIKSVPVNDSLKREMDVIARTPAQALNKTKEGELMKVFYDGFKEDKIPGTPGSIEGTNPLKTQTNPLVQTQNNPLVKTKPLSNISESEKENIQQIFTKELGFFPIKMSDYKDRGTTTESIRKAHNISIERNIKVMEIYNNADKENKMNILNEYKRYHEIIVSGTRYISEIRNLKKELETETNKLEKLSLDRDPNQEESAEDKQNEELLEESIRGLKNKINEYEKEQKTIRERKSEFIKSSKFLQSLDEKKGGKTRKKRKRNNKRKTIKK
jgi:hypothetical protein